MTKNSTLARPGMPNLSVVRKEEKEHTDAKLVRLKKLENKFKVLLPPQQEKYLKAKKHDFL